ATRSPAAGFVGPTGGISGPKRAFSTPGRCSAPGCGFGRVPSTGAAGSGATAKGSVVLLGLELLKPKNATAPPTPRQTRNRHPTPPTPARSSNGDIERPVCGFGGATGGGACRGTALGSDDTMTAKAGVACPGSSSD